MKPLLWACALPLVAFSLTSCMGLTTSSSAVAPGSGAQFASASASAVQAFQNSFYVFARANCAQCHGVSQTPMFAVADVSTAYLNASNPTYVDFADPINSLFVTFAGNGHCGVSNCMGSAQSSAAQTAIAAWSAAALAAGNTGGGNANSAAGLVPPSNAIQYLTAPMPIPSPLPAAGTKFALIRWNMSALSPPDTSLGAAIFEIQIQALTPQTYKVTMPRLDVSAEAVDVKGVHVLLNGQEFPLGMDWTSIEQVVAPTGIPTPLPKTALVGAPALTSDAMPLPIVNVATDTIQIGFESLIDNAGCANLNGTNGFVSNVLPQMTSICFGCHLAGATGVNAAEAFAAFPMINPAAAATTALQSAEQANLCASTLNWINVATPASSEIVLQPSSLTGLSTPFDPTPFEQWISTETGP